MSKASDTVKDSLLGCILLKIAKNGRELNKFLNLFNIKQSKDDWVSTKRGGLQSRCAQTSDVLDSLFNGVINIDTKLYVNPSVNLLPILLHTKVKNEEALLSITNPEYFENVINLLKKYNYNHKIVNLKIGIPRSGEKGKGFPGHVFNILITKENEHNIHIFICQSFIYTYNMKLFYTNDFKDLEKYLRNMSNLFYKSSSTFTLDDEVLYRRIFGADMVNYQLQNLASFDILKPKTINVKLTESNYDILYNSFNQCYKLLDEFKSVIDEFYSLDDIDRYYSKVYHEDGLVPGQKVKIIKHFIYSLSTLFNHLLHNKDCELNDRYNQVKQGFLPYSVQSTVQQKILF
jgi:hypothetical protein